MNIKVLGTGCKKCTDLVNNAKKAVEELGIDATVEKVEDIATIMKYGVMVTPGLVVNEEVKGTGRVLSVEEIKAML